MGRLSTQINSELEMIQLYESMDDMDLEEREQFQEALAANIIESKNTLINNIEFIDSLEARIEKIKEYESELKTRKHQIQRIIDHIKYVFKNYMEAKDLKKLELNELHHITRVNTESTEIINEFEIPDSFCDIVVTRKPKKAEIKKAIKEGQIVPGAEIQTNSYIRIK